jgi:signal peptidase II
LRPMRHRCEKETGLTRHRLFLLFCFVVLVLDRLTKLWAAGSLAEHQSMAAIPGFLYFTLTYNTGIAFGLLQNLQWLTIPVSVLIIFGAMILHFRSDHEDRWTGSALGLLVGGAIANLFDRIAYGRVTDFLDLRWWPVFNLADSAIVIAVFILALHGLFTPGHRPTPAEQVSE